MPPAPAYALLDAGDGRRLETIGSAVIDRPAPSAIEPARDPMAWAAASARFDDSGLGGPRGWTFDAPLPQPWLLGLEDLTLELRTTATGQIGLFPEHATLIPWLVDRVHERLHERAQPRVLHLFAYTGAITLALARAGATVAHVDAAKGSVAWARTNAAHSDLSDRPIRWLVDDAAAFVAREARRGRRYDGVVLDPPSYGHGPRGQTWSLVEDLDPLLTACAALTEPGAFVVVSTHTPGEDADRLAHRLRAAFPATRGAVDAGPLDLVASSGATLRLGAYARIMGR